MNNALDTVNKLKSANKMAPLSTFNQNVMPFFPWDKCLLKVLLKPAKIILKAFSKERFTVHVTEWGELHLFSNTLGIEVQCLLKENFTYLGNLLENDTNESDFKILNLNEICAKFVFSFRFSGTRSKWRNIVFDAEELNLQKVQDQIITQVLKVSKPFQGRLKRSLFKTNKLYCEKDTIYSIAQFAVQRSHLTLGLKKIINMFERYYIQHCFIGLYGVIMVRSSVHEIHIIPWNQYDRDLIAKFTPELILPYSNSFINPSDIEESNPETIFLLEVLEKILLRRFENSEVALSWLEDKKDSLQISSPNCSDTSIENSKKILQCLIFE